MWQLRYTNRSKSSLKAIAIYIAEASGNRATATRFTAKLRARCARLAALQQMMGRERPELAEGLRSVTEGNYVIFIRYIDGTLEVVNIIERHRDLDVLFGQDEPDVGH